MKLCIITGEASGDLHASHAVQALRSRVENLECFGVGGDRLRKQDMELLYHVRDLAIVGLFNVLRHIPMYRRVMASIEREVRERRPDAIILVDFPDFNLRLAKRLRRLGIPILYYISPQVWAWRKRRVREIARNVDHMMVIFPFEEEFFRMEGVPVSFVGHPLGEQLRTLAPDAPRGVPEERLRVALLPGSRSMEIDSLLPAMLGATEILSRSRQVEVFLIQASTIEIDRLERAAGKPLDHVSIVADDGAKTLRECDVAMASSGTATLEAAILGVPMVVMYRLSPLTYALARHLVDLEHFSLVNIVAGRRVVPELLQRDVEPNMIAEEIEKLVEPGCYRQTVEGLKEVREKLGDEPVGENVAQIILQCVEEARSS
ncbi:MAG: lipid-A-disaccharide synthase [Thermoanaerobaculia bacterium]|nr:lipid-A-disaccharide synthase [Thermoanaerobaculia bacterium]